MSKTVRFILIAYCLTMFVASIWVPWKGEIGAPHSVSGYYAWMMNADRIYLSTGGKVMPAGVDWSRLAAEYVAITSLYASIYLVFARKNS